jgi:uncharacterized protein (DUF885 family)
VRRWRRNLALAAALAAAAAALFLVPTLFGRPWSVDHLFVRVFLEFALERPMLLSRLRILEPYGIDFHSDDLDDFSPEFARESARKARRWLEWLRSYDRERMSPEQRLSTQVLDWFLATQVEGERFLFHDLPVNQMNGIQNELPDFMLNVHQIHERGDAEDYAARLSRFGRAFDQLIEGLRLREQRGVLPPRFVATRVLAGIDEFVAPPPGENVLYTHFAARLAEIPDLDAGERERLLADVRARIEQTVYPAYARLRRQLEHLERAAGTDDGVWRLPEGEAYYAWLLRWHTTSNRSADEIHALGLAEVARIQARMRALLSQQGLPAEDLAEAVARLRADPRQRYAEGERASILADYRAIVEDASGRLPALFGRLPRAPVVVERVPEFREIGSAAAYYEPPPFDGSKPGVFYANLRDVGEVARFRMRTLAYHEAIPGHHLQIAIAQELEGVPFFRRVMPFTAFIEGWALYAERLAAEQGFHATPLDELGQLVDEAFRAVRLVVDTGIHAQRWSRERAIDYMLANTGMPRGEVVAEIERYVVMPGQACAYKAGQLAILELRERARRELGERFDLRAFHDVLLGAGALPIELLESRLEAWIASRR